MDKQKGKILTWGEVPRLTCIPAGKEETPTGNEETAKILTTSLEFLNWLAIKDETRFNVLFLLFQLDKKIKEDIA